MQDKRTVAEFLVLRHLQQLPNMADLKVVACNNAINAEDCHGGVTMAAGSMWRTQFVPAVVGKSHWKGEHSASNTFTNCLATILATRRRREQPVEMPLTPPWFGDGGSP